MARLSIAVDSRHRVLAQTLPIEIRDASLKLLHTLQGQTTLDLNAGLYEVRALGAGGDWDRRLVALAEGGSEELRFRAEPAAEDQPVEGFSSEESDEAADAAEPDPGGGFNLMQEGFFPSEAAPSVAPSDDGDTSYALTPGAPSWSRLPEISTRRPDTPFELPGDAGLEAEVLAPGRWTVRVRGGHDDASARLPWLRWVHAGADLELALPLNPQGYEDCELVAGAPGQPPRVRFGRERQVARAMQGRLERGEILHAAHVADEARDMLRGKYNDPAAAPLGTLLLFKVGRLERHRDWAQNLHRDFPWFGDAGVLLAAVLSQSGGSGDLERAAEYLLDSASRPLLLTDCVALRLSLLRRLPIAKDDEPKAREYRQQASLRLPGVLWDSALLGLDTQALAPAAADAARPLLRGL